MVDYQVLIEVKKKMIGEDWFRVHRYLMLSGATTICEKFHLFTNIYELIRVNIDELILANVSLNSKPAW